MVIILSWPALAQDPTGQYKTSPYGTWFANQHNAQGGYCCNEADGHLFTDGDYQINADGTVTLFLQTGGTINIAFDVAHGSWDGIQKIDNAYARLAPDPNPTGYPVIWYTGTLTAGETSNIYCFAEGALT